MTEQTLDSVNLIKWGKQDLTSNLEIKISDDYAILLKKDGQIVFIEQKKNNEIVSSECFMGEEHSLFIEPALPDRPLVLKPLNKIVISAGEKIEVFIDIPYSFNILIGTTTKKNSILEIPTVALSKSFFGSSENGEVAYSLSSPFFTDFNRYSKTTHSIYCPLTIYNKSTQLLQFERMLLRVPNLTLYRGEQNLYAGAVQVTFTGQDQYNQVLFRKTAPTIESGLKAIAHPRVIEKNSILHKSFYLIKNIYNGY